MSGQTFTNILTLDGICRIIEVSAKNRVTKLKLGELELAFGASEEDHNKGVVPVTPEQHERMNTQQLYKDAEEMSVEKIKELLLTDPLAYEDALFKGELRPDVHTDSE